MGEEFLNAGVIRDGINAAIADCHGAAVRGGWYTDLKTGQPKTMNKGERFMLMVSEISEALSGLSWRRHISISVFLMIRAQTTSRRIE